jgi:hypothetical protein
MSSIIRRGDTFHGISVESRGVFTNDKFGTTYAGQCRDGYACGLGVATYYSGYNRRHKEYAEHGPDGEFDGRKLGRWANGASWYGLCERGKVKEYAVVNSDGTCEYNGKDCAPDDPQEYAVVNSDGTCKYNGKDCAPDDPRVLALIALVAPVEVRPAAPAPHPLLGPPLRPQAIVRWIGRLVLPPTPAGAGEDRGHRGAFPRRTPSLVAVRHNPRPAALQRTTTQ